jgi:hypothetical protein
MQNLIQLLEKTLVEARETKALHARQLEAMQSAFDQKLSQERVELLEEYEDTLDDLRRSHASELEAERERFDDLAKETEEARELLAKVDAQTVGVLPTEYLPARMLFDKLAERWETLSVADVEMIEAVLDNKVISI